jgi:small subunit ribosomal protein S6
MVLEPEGDIVVRNYDLVAILKVTMTDEEIDSAVAQLEQYVTNGGGEVRSVERWGKRTLAYEIAHQVEGYYVVVSFVAPPDRIADLSREIALDERILRHKVIRMPDRPVRRIPSDVSLTTIGSKSSSSSSVQLLTDSFDSGDDLY